MRRCTWNFNISLRQKICVYLPLSMLIYLKCNLRDNDMCPGVTVSITAQLDSAKPEIKFCAGSNPARGMSKICNCKNL